MYRTIPPPTRRKASHADGSVRLVVAACALILFALAARGQDTTPTPSKAPTPSAHQAPPAAHPNGITVADRLFRIPNGFLGLRANGGDCFLTTYNDTLATLQAFLYAGLTPYDFATVGGNSQSGVVLGSYAGLPCLLRVNLASGAHATFIWKGTQGTLRHIAGAADFDGNGAAEIAAYGEGGFALVGVDGHERFVLRENVVAAIAARGDSVHIYAAWRDGDGIRLAALDASTGRVLAARDLPDAGTPIMRMVETSAGERLLVLGGGMAPRAYLFEPNLDAAYERFALPAAPLGVAQYQDDDGIVAAAILGAYPAPMMMQLGATPEQQRDQRLEYPLTGLPVSANIVGRYLALAARDTVVLYNRSFAMVGTIPSVGSPDATIVAIDSSRLLISSPTMSRVIAIPGTPEPWVVRHWPTVALAVFLGIAIVGVVMLVRRERFIRAVHNNLVRAPGSSGVVITSASQRVRHVNASARRLLGIEPLTPLGRHLLEYLTADEHAPVREALRRLFAEGIEFDQRVDVVSDGQQRALIFRGRPMTRRYGSLAGYLLLMEDVTLTLERERLVNWASVAHHIAHEMKTPLGTVRMTAEMLHDKVAARGDDPDSQRAAQRIVRQSIRLREIVDDLLTVARTESLDRVPDDLGRVVSALIHDHADSLPSNVEVRLELNGAAFPLELDSAQLTVALRNMLDNAVQAIGSRQEGLVRVSLTENTNALVLIVEDNGIGMSTGTLAKLFQPFYTERQGGSGIGTVIIKRVIEGHGGTIAIESERGKGTRFIITFHRA